MDATFLNQNIENKPFYKKLTTNITCDYVIVGGGISGCLMAYYLNNANKKTVLLEQDRIAGSYTSYNNACITYDFNIPFFSAKRSTKKEEPIKKTYELLKTAIAELDKITNEIEPCDYKIKDSIIFSTRKSDIKKFENESKLINESGILANLITNTNSVPTTKMKIGIQLQNGARELNPIKFCYNILDFCQNIGVYEQTQAEFVDYTDDYVRVITDEKYEIHAKKVIFTCPNFMQTEEKQSFFTTNTLYTVITDKIENLPDSLKRNIIYSYDKKPLVYREIDGRMMSCKSCADFVNEDEQADVFDFLKRKLCCAFSNVKNCNVAFQDKSKFLETKDNLPYIFKDTSHKELIYMLSVGRSGIAFSTLCSKLVSRWCLGEENAQYELFSLER